MPPLSSVSISRSLEEFALFLGLQVNPLYGNIGLVAIAVLAVFYVYIGFLKK